MYKRQVYGIVWQNTVILLDRGGRAAMAQGRKAVKYGRIGLKLIVFLMALWISGRGSTITAGAFYEDVYKRQRWDWAC